MYGNNANLHSFHGQILTTVLIHLSVFNEIAATGKYNAASVATPTMESSEAGKCIVDLLYAFETGDAELFKGALAKPVVKYLEVEVVRMSKTMVLPASGATGGAFTKERNYLQDEIEEEGYL